MTKSRLDYVVKARTDFAMKNQVELLIPALGFHDEADIVRRALRQFIQQNKRLLPHFAQADQTGSR